MYLRRSGNMFLEPLAPTPLVPIPWDLELLVLTLGEEKR